MRLRQLISATAAVVALTSAHASPQEEWSTLSRFLSVLEIVMQAAAKDDERQVQKTMDDIVAGRNAEANALASELFSDVPDAERKRMLSIGRSVFAVGQKQAAIQERSARESAAIQARKDLAGMGHTYFDKGEFLDAVKRGDLIAVRLFLAARSVDPSAKDVWGNSALDLAKKSGNTDLISLLNQAARQ